jgi:hypothetical protein
VPKTMPNAQYSELRLMVVKAARAESVQRAYQVDYCQASNLTSKPTVAWFYEQIGMWKRLSNGVSIGNN